MGDCWETVGPETVWKLFGNCSKTVDIQPIYAYINNMLSRLMEEDNDSIPYIEWRIWNKWYWYKGTKVVTEYGNAAKAKCCAKGCRHCPFHPLHSGSDQLRKDLRGRLGYRIGPID